MAGRELRSAAEEGRDMEGRGLDEEEEGWVTTPDQSKPESESENNDSDGDPTFEAIERTRSKLSRMSLKKSRPRASKGMEIPQFDDKEKNCFETIEKIVKDGNLDNLKIGDCKIYLRKYGLRLTGNKAVLQARIKAHLEVMEGRGEKKYPMSSFVLNCKGDACMGDVVIFEQNVYDMFNIASRSATAPPCGTRTVAGRIVKESYGAAKQQHTFTIEVLWSKGEKPLPPLHPLLIKGRNLYRLKTMRQRWDDEEEREKVLQEKHRRGCLARCSRETRIREKEMKKVARGKRHQALTSEKPIAAGAQKTRHQALVSAKPTAAGGRGNDVHHQEPDKCSYGAQCKQNDGSAQVLQTQPSAISLPPVERRIYQEAIRHCNAIHQRPDVNICNTVDHDIHHQNACIRSEKPIGTSQNSFHDLQLETYDYRRQVKPQACSYPSAFGSPQHRYHLHASHRYGYPDRKPLRNLNASSILGCPPHGNHVHSNHQNGFSGAKPSRNFSSPSRIASQMPRYHPVQRQPCHLYLQGRCWYGDNCRYLH